MKIKLLTPQACRLERLRDLPPEIFPIRRGAKPYSMQDIFNIKKKTAKLFEMRYILEGKFCGVCHLDVAFPLDECELCHPGIRRSRGWRGKAGAVSRACGISRQYPGSSMR